MEPPRFRASRLTASLQNTRWSLRPGPQSLPIWSANLRGVSLQGTLLEVYGQTAEGFRRRAHVTGQGNLPWQRAHRKFLQQRCQVVI